MGLLTLGLLGCAGDRLPSPRGAAEAYAAAAARGDGDAIYAMLTREAQREYGRSGTRARVEEARGELAKDARALGSPHASIAARAELRLSGGELVELTLEEGEYRLTSASALPAAARSPAQALSALRAALMRRSLPQLFSLMSAETRASFERDVQALIDGLEYPDSLSIVVEGDRAQLTLPSGQRIRLLREDGVWRVEAVE
ncbi:MAG: hypothetical protein KIT72_14225 [Polyangiaceae bacterium]|nr:hypothetical protein [Polyangiaceae bacterium]MCW5791570.1 hypothetical protein [Polyangiaceae bacterium]